MYTLLHAYGILQVRHLILNEGLTANHQFADGSFPLHIAADHQEFEILKFLLSLKASPDFKNRHGQTPLMLGITHGSRSVEIVQVLVNYSCKVNLCDSQKRTALHLAGAKGLIKVMHILLVAGARVNIHDRWGRTPLHVTLLNLSQWQAVSTNYVDAVQLLLAHGSDPNKADKNLATPLFLAVAAGDKCVNIFQLLISYGGHPDKLSRHKLTPVMLSVMKGHELLCKLLIEQNCNVNALNPVTNKSCFFTAVQKGYISIVKCLVEGGVDLTKENWLFNGTYYKSMPTNSELLEWLNDLVSCPLPLKQLCRTRLRCSLGYHIKRKVKKLEYPEVLKQYILLADNV